MSHVECYITNKRWPQLRCKPHVMTRIEVTSAPLHVNKYEELASFQWVVTTLHPGLNVTSLVLRVMYTCIICGRDSSYDTVPWDRRPHHARQDLSMQHAGALIRGRVA